MVDDLLDRMRRNPQAGWTIEDVEKLCQQYNVSCEAARGSGSHYRLFGKRLDHIMTVPSGRSVKPIHIRRVVRFLDLVRFLELIWHLS
ncbi:MULTISPECIES: type II toxin-antitoxin system HicA family toxin [Bradyrhizobium]|uniref:type II toxin-antitoxin system HicA family toxin n=1 Tax=Bradyrhizobium TaxID=374 RepID=UPI001029C9AA|nr:MULTISPECIES: type II toxin-antitoxin system HicA family toxin [Bradyrhizobium]